MCLVVVVVLNQYVCIVHSGRAAPTLHIHYLQTVLASAAPIILTFIHPRRSGSAVPTSTYSKKRVAEQTDATCYKHIYIAEPILASKTNLLSPIHKLTTPPY